MAKTSIIIAVSFFVLLLGWLFEVYPWMWWARASDTFPPPVSYDGRIHFNLNHLYTPQTEEEIVKIVQDAYKLGRKIRVLADGHSWSLIAQTQDIMISLVKYRGLVDVNKEDMTATFKAGTPLRVISEELDKLDLAMANQGSVAGQSLAGAISTGTHGTGLTVGNLATLVVEMKLISGDNGKVMIISENNNSEYFKAAQVSIGMFGVISEIKIKVLKKFKLKEMRTHHPLSYCLENLDELVRGNKYVKMWVEFYNEFCVLYQTDVTDEPITTIPSLEGFLIYYSFAVQTRILYLLPSLTPYLMYFVDLVGFGCDTIRVDNSYKIFNDYFDLPIHQEGEVVIHYNDSKRAVNILKEVIINEKIPVNYMTEVRFIKGDEIYLSPQQDTDPGTCAITLTIYAPETIAVDYFNKVYAAMKPLNARFHWGKHFNHNYAEIQELYPKLKEFATLRKILDPKDIFINDFLQEKFHF